MSYTSPQTVTIGDVLSANRFSVSIRASIRAVDGTASAFRRLTKAMVKIKRHQLPIEQRPIMLRVFPRTWVRLQGHHGR